MDEHIQGVSDVARLHNIPCGNTEGWGPIGWLDYPDTDWKWVKEAGSICVDLAKKHDNYKFICSSNFTHPQFRGMWGKTSSGIKTSLQELKLLIELSYDRI